MKFGYTIIYVPDVEEALKFYVKAFKIPVKFLHESKQYGELDTGSTTLAFSSEELAQANGIELAKNNRNETPAGIEVAFVTDNVDDTYEHATASGATAVAPPTKKPWGQTVAYVRDLNGVLVELCSPINK